MMIIKALSRPLIGFTLLIISFLVPVYAGPFIGVDGTMMTATIDWDQTKPRFDLSPVRLKFGYQWGLFGVEGHAYTAEKDSDQNNGYQFNFELNESYGAYLRAQEKWIYARVGVTWIDTTVEAVGIAKNSDTVPAVTLALGIDYPVTDNLSISLDYTYATGKVHYPDITASGPGLVDPTLQFEGGALGINYKFW